MKLLISCFLSLSLGLAACGAATSGQTQTAGLPSPSAPTALPSPVSDPTRAAVNSIRLLQPALQIGKGAASGVAASPDGRWMAVATPLGVYQYAAADLTAAWFAPLDTPPGALAFDPASRRLAVGVGSDILLLDAAGGQPLGTLAEAGGSFAWSPDGARLVSGGGCETVSVWDVERQTVLRELRGERCSEGYSGISVTWAGDGRIYAGPVGRQILAWEGDSLTPPAGFAAEGQENTWINSLAAAPAGSLFAQYDSMGGADLAILDGQAGQQVRRLAGPADAGIDTLSWAPDGRRLAVAYRGSSGLVRIWDAAAGTVERDFPGALAAGLAWSPDGRTLYGFYGSDGRLQAVDAADGQVLGGLDGFAPAGTFLSWTAQGLMTTDGMALTTWDTASGQALSRQTIGAPQALVASWPSSGPGPYLFQAADGSAKAGVSPDSPSALDGAGQGGPAFPSAWSPDGKHLADPTRVWEVTSGRLITRVNDPDQQHTPDKVAWSPDGSRLASADSLDMQPPLLWDPGSGAVRLRLAEDFGALRPLYLDLAWSPDGQRIAAAGALLHSATGEDTGMIVIWDAANGQIEQTLTAGMDGLRLNRLAWSPDGSRLAAGTSGTQVYLWDVAGGHPAAQLAGPAGLCDELAWSPDGQRLAGLCRDGVLWLWDLPK